jgi:hypothetical protein
VEMGHGGFPVASIRGSFPINADFDWHAESQLHCCPALSLTNWMSTLLATWAGRDVPRLTGILLQSAVTVKWLLEGRTTLVDELVAGWIHPYRKEQGQYRGQAQPAIESTPEHLCLSTAHSFSCDD